MNSSIIFIISIILLALGYKFYSKILIHVFGINDDIPTPAHSHKDGCDFIPARHWTILFSHHFSSIAGAGPIIGPVLAVMIWGWAPTVLWIILGSILLGGVHDFGAMVVSVRYKGASIADVTKDVISKRAHIIFAIFVWLALVLVDAIFVIFAAKTFVSEPSVILPALGIIPVAVIVGYFLYTKNASQSKTTIFGLVSLLVLILLGPKLHINLSLNVWIFILLAYGYVASVTPVNILLQPRDYLSGYLLVLGILFGAVGILVSHPALNVPAFAKSPVPSPLFPMLFVTVACGAISGFHSLVASGTTSKQLDKERDAVKVGYGGMIVEGVLAVIALLAVAAGLGASEAKSLISNPIAAFGQGFGNLCIPFLGSYGKVFALLILNAFVLTTLDTATRITRYLTQEIFGIKNRYIATVIVIVCAGWLALSGEGNKIWPVFGASNQLVAALALIVISAWLMQNGRRIRYTLWPMIFMLITTVYALLFQARGFLASNNYVLAIVSLVLVLLAAILFVEAVMFWVKKRKGSNKDKT